MPTKMNLKREVTPSEEWIETYWFEFETSVLSMTKCCINELLENEDDKRDWIEADYSYKLCTFMENYCYCNELSISPRYEEVISENGKSAKKFRKIDIKIRWYQHRRDIYYAIEAKVLVEKTGIRSYSPGKQMNEYITEGMQRFITGKYSRGLPDGIMLGYVLNGKAKSLVPRINNKLHELEIPNEYALGLEGDQTTVPHYKSEHPRESSGNIILHHLFAEFNFK